MLNYFPFDNARQCQIDVAALLEQMWNKYDVFVLNMPTASGKSAIAVMLQNWLLSKGTSCEITVPNNILRDQYMSEFSHLRTVKAQDDYMLAAKIGPRGGTSYVPTDDPAECVMTEYDFRHKIYKHGPKGSKYAADLAEVKRVGTPIVTNYYTHLAHKLFRKVLIVDEGHQLRNMLQTLAAKHVWQHIHKYPAGMNSYDDVLTWLNSKSALTPTLEALRHEVRSMSRATILQMAQEPYRGELCNCLKLIPLSVAGAPPIFWPSKTNKIILMSATINAHDIKAMGLDSRRVAYIDVESPIPYERRPVRYEPIGNMGFAEQDDNLEALAGTIIDNASRRNGKGFIHATYSLATKLKPYLQDDPRFMFHSYDNKMEVYNEFYKAGPESGKVLIGSGMYEGIDLKFDVASWQMITKIPFPSLLNPAMRYLMENDIDQYYNYVTKDVLQACGRICRDPKDYGETIIVDSCFNQWFSHVKSELPSWFKVEGLC